MFVMDDVWMTTKSAWIDVSSEKTFICNDFKAVCRSTCLSQSFHLHVTYQKHAARVNTDSLVLVWNFWLLWDRYWIDSGCKMIFFFYRVGDELIWIAASCVHEDGVPWVGSCDHSNQHLHLFLPRFVQIIMLEVN